MPELPEVQTVVDTLNQRCIAGRTITGARVRWAKTVAPLSPAVFRKRISGCRIQSICRRAKYIVFDLSEGLTLLIHLRMTGRLDWMKRGRSVDKHEHVILEMGRQDDLRFHDTRKFGRILLTDTPESVLGKLGPEPLARSFTGGRLQDMLSGRQRQIKPLLLDQTFVAGLGNIYVDEALWKAGIHPLRIASALNEKEAAGLHWAIRQVLRQGLKNSGTSLGSGKSNFYSVGSRPGRNAENLKVFRRTDAPCPRCRTSIQRIVVGQRSSHVCPACQKAPA